MKNQNTQFPTAATTDYATVFAAIELSDKNWLLGIHTPLSDKIGLHTIAAHDAPALIAKLAQIREKVEQHLGRPVRVMSVYEAGRDGFWLHRLLDQAGIDNQVIDAASLQASLQVSRRARRAKSDRIDARSMLRALMAFARGEEQVFSVLQVPDIAQEDARRTLRERRRLIKERIAHSNRIKALLATQGVYDFKPLRRDRLASLKALALPEALNRELGRQLRRLALTLEMIDAVEAERDATLAASSAEDENARKIRQLHRLRGLGPELSTGLVRELYYRRFANRRKLAGFVGFCPSPFNSGGMVRDQGISKAGPPRIRVMAIELAWMWLRYQPDSALSRWFRERVGDIKGRIRRITIVALARKLLVALWRYLETGLIPEGAQLKA